MTSIPQENDYIDYSIENYEELKVIAILKGYKLPEYKIWKFNGVIDSVRKYGEIRL